MPLKISVIVSMLISLMLFTSGCGGGDLSAATSSSSSGSGGSTDNSTTPGGGNQDTPPAKNYFYIHGSSTSGIEVNTHKKGNWSEKCQVDLDDATAANRDIECTVEVKELDLYHQGLKLGYNFPASNKCVYAYFLPYFFYQYKVGNGPTTVFKTLNTDGSVLVSSSGGDSGGTVSNVGGEAVCGFNYGGLSPDSGRPNCCMGKYTLQVTDLNKPAGEQVTTTTGNEWGGNIGSCLGGAGKDHLPNKTYNFPRTAVLRLGGTSGEGTYEIASPISLELGTNLHVANYLENPSSPPTALTAPTSFSFLPPNPYYTWTCLDEAEEIYARIRVSVREWNTVSEYLKKDAGNSNATGTEDYWGDDNNDRSDWEDFINAVGFDGFPWAI